MERNVKKAPKSFGKKLKRFRNQLGLSRQEVADEVHMSRITIYHIEEGLYIPSLRTADHLSRWMDENS